MSRPSVRQLTRRAVAFVKRSKEDAEPDGRTLEDYETSVEEEVASYEEESGGNGSNALFRSWRVFPRAARYLRPYRRQAGASIGITVVLAVVALAEPWPLAFVIDSVLGEKPAPGWVTGVFGSSTGKLILFSVVATLLVTLVGGGFTIVNEYIQTKLAGRMGLDFRSDLFQHVQRLSFTHHENMRTGQMMYRMTNSDGALELMVDIPNFAQNVLTMVGMAWIVWQLDPALAQLAMVVVPLMYFSTTYYANRIEPAVVQVRAMEAMSLAIAHEALAMVRVITSFGRERHEFDRFRRQGEQAVDARVRLTIRQTMFNLAVSLITALGTATVLGVGAYRVLRGQISSGELLVIMAYIAQVYSPLESLTGFLTRSQQSFIMFQYALDLLDTQPDVVEKPDAVAIGRAKADITFEGVGFDYQSRPDVLREISFHVEAGRAVAIVGQTGAGKSTLLSLLPRFYDPSTGRVLIDGADLRDLTLESVRAQFSIVLQEPLLFSGSIKDNIRYGKLDATDDEIIDAAKAANAHDFITRLPQQYETELGERGAKISGGERQRLAVARAFLRDAPILILDEPTSSIDSKTEGVILDALERLMVGRTTIMVAHRLSTIRSVDHILVLDGGRIVEEGTHDELVSRSGLYYQLWEAQARQRKRKNKPKASGPMMLEWRLTPEDAAELATPEMGSGRRRRRPARRARAQHAQGLGWRPTPAVTPIAAAPATDPPEPEPVPQPAVAETIAAPNGSSADAEPVPEPAVAQTPAETTGATGESIPNEVPSRRVWEWRTRERRWRKAAEHAGGNGAEYDAPPPRSSSPSGPRRSELVTVATAFAEPIPSRRQWRREPAPVPAGPEAPTGNGSSPSDGTPGWRVVPAEPVDILVWDPGNGHEPGNGERSR